MLYEYMNGLGYTNEEIIKIRNTYPVNKLREEKLVVAIKKIYNFLIDFGYTDKQLKKIFVERPHIFCLDISSIDNKINNLKKIGYSNKVIIQMTTDFPTLYSYGVESILIKVEEYESLGYSREVIIKNTKKYPELFGYSMDTVRNKINELVKLGYSYEDVIRITSKNMGILNFAIENIKNKIDGIVGLGFTYEEAIYITRYPSILNFTVQYMKSKMLALTSLGYTYSQVVKIMKLNPSLFGERVEKLKAKKEFYDSIGLFDIFIITPGNLKQSIELSYARYMFLCSLNIKLNMEDSSYRELFISNRRFEMKYNVSKEELVKKYNYDNYLEVKKSGRVV